MIRIECSNGHKLKVKDEHAGKKLKCPACGARISVPAAGSASDPAPSGKPRAPKRQKRKAPQPIIDEPKDEVADDDDEWGFDEESEYGDSEYETASPLTLPGGGISLAGSPGAQQTVRKQQPVPEKKPVPVVWFVVGGGVVALILIGVVIAILVSGGSGSDDVVQDPDNVGGAEQSLPGVAQSDADGGTDPTVPNPGTDSGAGQPQPASIVNMIADVPAIPSAPRGLEAQVTVEEIHTALQPKATSTAMNETSRPRRTGNAMPVEFPEESTLAVGKRVVIPLPKNAPGVVEVAVVSADDADAQPQWVTPLTELPPAGPNSIQIGLEAAVNAQQELIYVDDDAIELLSNLSLPTDIRLGSERMKVLEIDEFTGALRIGRTDGVWHSVTEPLFAGGGDGDAAFFSEGQPLRLDEQSLHWIPTADHVGEKVIRLRWDGNRSFGAGTVDWKVTITDGPVPSSVSPEELLAATRPAEVPFEVWDRPERFVPDNVNPGAQSKPASRKDQGSISRVLTGLRRGAKQGIAVSFQPGFEDALEVQFRPVASGSAAGSNVQSVQVAAGAGVPLYEFKGARWDPNDWDKEVRDLKRDDVVVNYPEANPLCRLHRMSSVLNSEQMEMSPEPTSEPMELASFSGKPYRKVLWSSDGKSLYLLMQERGELHRIDVETWQITCTVQPNMGIRDLTLCSEGIAALASPGNPRRGSGGMSDGWMQMEPNGDPQAMAEAQTRVLLLMDPETLTVKSAIHAAGDIVAGREVSDLIYTQDIREQRIAVLDVREKALLNLISIPELGDSLPADDNAAGVAQRQPLPPIGRIEMSADAQYLIGYGSLDLLDDEFNLMRLAINGANLTLEEFRRDVPTASGVPHLTTDASLACFNAPSNPPRIHLMQTAGLNRYTHSLTVGQPPLAFAADPTSKAILCAQPKTTSGRIFESDVGKVELTLFQFLDQTVIALGKDRVLDMHAHPLGRGFLVTTLTAVYWLELPAQSEYWPFEWNAPAQMPVVRSALQATVPDSPVIPDEKSSDQMTVIDISATAMAWAPDGSAYFALVHANRGNGKHGYSVHRFDAATNTETHRLEPSIGRPVVPTMFTTTAGVVFDDRSNRKVFLLSFEDLNPVWELDARYASFANGHHDHERIATTSAGGYVLFNASDGQVVARTGTFDLRTTWPDSSMDRISWIVATPDPNVVEFWAGETAVFRAVDGHFTAERLVPNSGARKTLRVEEAQYTPDGYQYQLESGSRGQRPVTLLDESGQVVRRISQPSSASGVAGHPTDPSLALFLSGGDLCVVRTPLK